MQAKWLGVKEASKNLGISQATLWNLKNTLCLDAGKHWIYVTGKKNSNVLRWTTLEHTEINQRDFARMLLVVTGNTLPAQHATP